MKKQRPFVFHEEYIVYYDFQGEDGYWKYNNEESILIDLDDKFQPTEKDNHEEAEARAKKILEKLHKVFKITKTTYV